MSWDVVREAMAAYEATFAAFDGIDAKIRPAVDGVQADFEYNFAEPEHGLFINILLPDLNHSRELANLLAVADAARG